MASVMHLLTPTEVGLCFEAIREHFFHICIFPTVFLENAENALSDVQLSDTLVDSNRSWLVLDVDAIHVHFSHISIVPTVSLENAENTLSEYSLVIHLLTASGNVPLRT